MKLSSKNYREQRTVYHGTGNLWLHLSIPPHHRKGENSLESLISLSALLFVGILKILSQILSDLNRANSQ